MVHPFEDIRNTLSEQKLHENCKKKSRENAGTWKLECNAPSEIILPHCVTLMILQENELSH